MQLLRHSTKISIRQYYLWLSHKKVCQRIVYNWLIIKYTYFGFSSISKIINLIELHLTTCFKVFKIWFTFDLFPLKFYGCIIWPKAYDADKCRKMFLRRVFSTCYHVLPLRLKYLFDYTSRKVKKSRVTIRRSQHPCWSLLSIKNHWNFPKFIRPSR